MQEYSFVVAGNVTFITRVRADSIEEAVQVAQSRSAMSLPALAHGDSSVEWTTEIDCDGPGDCPLEDAMDEGRNDITKEAKAFW